VCVVEVSGSGTQSYSGHRHTRGQAKCARLVKVGNAMTSLHCVRVLTARLCPRQALKRPKPFCAPTHLDRTSSSRLSSEQALFCPYVIPLQRSPL